MGLRLHGERHHAVRRLAQEQRQPRLEVDGPELPVPGALREPPVETWVSSPADAIAAIASTDARFTGDVTAVLYGKNPEVTEYHGNPTYYVTSTMVGYTGVHTWRFDPVRQTVGLPF